MNKTFITGNLTKDPELRTTKTGVSVCSFTVAVNRKIKKEGEPDVDFFHVTALLQLGEVCKQWLNKGKKVLVNGSVSCEAYIGKDGKPYAQMKITADEVEFLSPLESLGKQEPEQKASVPAGYTDVQDEPLPF